MSAKLTATYAAKHAVIMAHLATINEHMNNIPEPETPGLKWADVGDLERIELDLEAIVEYLA